MLQLNNEVTIPDAEIQLTAIRARGPGGQHVNKVATAIQLRFDIDASNALPTEVKQRLLALNDHRITANGIVVLKAQQFRSQEKNRAEALRKLARILSLGFVEEKVRKKTQPSRKEKEKRLADKSHRAKLKRSRSGYAEE